MLDGHVRPRTGDDDRVAPEARQERLELRPLPGAHAHLLDDQVTGLGLEAVGRGCTPRPPDEGVRVLDALEQRGVQLEGRRALLDDVVHVDHRDAFRPARRGQRLHVLDDILLLRVTGRAGVGEGAAVHDHVVLEVLDDEDTALRVQLQCFLVGHPFLL